VTVIAAQAKVDVDNIPQALRDRAQWVVWRYETSAAGRATKVPYDARTSRKASSTNPTTWTSFDVAKRAYEQGNGRYDGIGFVFTREDPYCGIDLDDCIGADGAIAPWAREIVDRFPSYTEISPSETGLKLYLRGRKPEYADCAVKDVDPSGGPGELELYDHSRYFCVTGNRWPGSPTDLSDRQVQLEALCQTLWSPGQPRPMPAPSPGDDRMAECLRQMPAIRRDDKFDGSLRLYACCCRCVEWDLPDAQALTCIRAYAAQRPFPRHWTDAEIIKRLRAAESKAQRGAALRRIPDSAGGLPTALRRADGDGRGAPDPELAKPNYRSVRELLVAYPHLRRPVIHGLLREGETMNVIAPPKAGKSWLVTDLALAVATGRPWLGTFPTEQGNVLILDNELHGETTANRIPRVAEARGIPLEQIADAVFVENLRGQLRDLIALGPYFGAIEPGTFKLVILDAFYRFVPRDTDENDNGSVAQLYNHLDHYAQHLGCSFILIHHASKGNQSGKAITDVGAGAGSQSRATDAHVVLRAHEEDGVAVLDAAVRSWPPIEPMCMRWDFPVFNPAPELDLTALRPDRPRRKPREPNPIFNTGKSYSP
jgi:hypothetical protein